ncbi:type ISP restriction/modification enzyme [Winogradskyella marina]|uniref:type ISP restriction/modification enzyme n=1 Tax=Winogradskyella marina TaxID=2785530 RepID=UPI001E3DAC35|nr:type ISP restriction/modification enzyme [Winogradskyella marina]
MEELQTNHIQKLTKQISKRLGLTFILETEPEGNVCFINSEELRDDYKTSFRTIDVLDYSYALLQSPSNREKYNAFLVIDDPNIPIPKHTDTFWELVRLGKSLRQIHLLDISKKEEVDIFRYKDIVLALTKADA